MQREDSSGQSSRQGGDLAPNSTTEDPAEALRRFGLGHKAILDALAACERMGTAATPLALVNNLLARGVASDTPQIGEQLQERIALGMVRYKSDGTLELDSDVPVLGEIS
jgi:hypothetical protein